MKRTLLVLFVPAVAWLALSVAQDPTSESRWWRGNTHTHTLWSDGDGAPELVADWYASNGYDFLVLSDHNILSQGDVWFPVEEEGRLTKERVTELRERFGITSVTERMRGEAREMRLKTLDELRGQFEQPGRFLFLQGEEISDAFEDLPVHVNGINLGEPIRPQGGTSLRETLQRNVDAVIAQGEELGRPVLAHVNHPNFGWAFTAEDLAHVRGERFFEVYNGHPGVNNGGDDAHPGAEAMWDVALTLRLAELDLGPLYGIACDDAHNYFDVRVGKANVGRAWVMVRAPELTPEAIIAAMKAGDFYSTTGVHLDEVSHADGRYTIRIDAEEGLRYTTRFIGTRRKEDGLGETGEVLFETQKNPAVYRFRGQELYVRATVVSSRPHPNPSVAGDLETAWAQPVVPE